MYITTFFIILVAFKTDLKKLFCTSKKQQAATKHRQVNKQVDRKIQDIHGKLCYAHTHAHTYINTCILFVCKQDILHVKSKENERLWQSTNKSYINSIKIQNHEQYTRHALVVMILEVGTKIQKISFLPSLESKLSSNYVTSKMTRTCEKMAYHVVSS